MAKFWKIIKAVIFGWGALTLVVLLLLWLVNIKATIFNDDARPEPLWEPRIVKRALNIREAWQIGENDPDISALQEDSEPIVPE